MGKNFTAKIKVLFFITSLDIGGAERVMLHILRHLDRNRFFPILLLLYQYNELPYSKYLPEDLKILVLQRKSESFTSKIKQAITFLLTVGKIKPDIIFSMLTHCNILALFGKLLFRTKIIITEHSTLSAIIKTPDGAKILGLPVSFLVKTFYRFADKIITVSEGVRDDLIEKFNISWEKIKNIPNPIDLELISQMKIKKATHPFFEKSVPVIISVGRLVKAKGFDILLNSFKKVIKKINARMIIIGEGPERNNLEILSKKLGISDKVSFAGFQENPFQFLAKGDLYVLSSRYEGMPLSLLEAMACGLPVIAFDCKSGPREILKNGEFGILVPAGDEEKLTSSILELLMNDEIRLKMSVLSQKRAEEFSAKNIIIRYEKELAELF
ncbi:MAG: glycosyltransferase [Nitrospirae bacterium]|jgi:glycosyltransferase involved in cell wall biosynthesis|nr:glycosyltransferase [Nitrospirota bacterium]